MSMQSESPPAFELLVVVSADGFIARHPGDHPGAWASAAEQARFRAAVPTYDWAFMGRTTHEAAFKAERRRVVFSRGAVRLEWRTACHLWVDPAKVGWAAIVAAVGAVRPLRRAVVLGGTTVHDRFLAEGLLTRIELSVERVELGHGLTTFTGDAGRPLDYLLARGWRVVETSSLGEEGTLVHVLEPG